MMLVKSGRLTQTNHISLANATAVGLPVGFD